MLQKISKFYILALLLLLGTKAMAIEYGYNNLTPGDIVVVNVTSTSEGDSLALLVLADIPGNEVFYISDISWDATLSSYYGIGENAFKFTTNAEGISAGTIIRVDNPTGDLYELEDPNLGTLDFYYLDGEVVSGAARKFILKATGDQIIIFQTTDGEVTSAKSFIYAFNYIIPPISNSTNGWKNSYIALTSRTDSHLPPGLEALDSIQSNKTTATAMGIGGLKNLNNGNWIYIGPVSAGDKDEWLTRIHTLSNWATSSSIYSNNTIANGAASVPVFPAVTISITSSTHVSCYGGTDGSITATATAGMANYDYSWSNGSTTTNTPSLTNTISGLSTGTYSVTVTDDAGTSKTTSFTITQPALITGTDVQTACNSYTWIDGNTYTASNSTATWTLTSASGCDSVVTLDLTVNHSTTGTDVQTACDSYTWIDGNTYTSSNNTATWTLTNAANCDSVVTLDLTINTVNNNVSVTEPIISADALGATYQWLNCTNNYAVISGEINQSFTATASGEYAVKIEENGCTDTSECVTISINDFENQTVLDEIKIYPNPSIGLFYIDFDFDFEFEILDITGQLIEQGNSTNSKTVIDLQTAPKGLYYIRIKTDNEARTIRLVLQ
jgi:uncharacterized protein (DUF2141 family)